jgi:integrase
MARIKRTKTDYEWLRQKRNHGGSIRSRNGKLSARIQYIGEDGEIHEKERQARNRKHARELIKQMRDELKTGGEAMLDAHHMTFAGLARDYEEKKLIPAVIVDGKKVAGMRSYASTKRFLVPLLEYFGRKRLHSIRHSDLEAYKLARLKSPVPCGVDSKGRTIFRQRSIAGVNRELELLRAMLRFAEHNDWITKSPFRRGASLISKASEHQRDRVLTFDEERRLLEACGDRIVEYTRRAHKRGSKRIPAHKITATLSGENRAYLRALIITALDTGMRRGELFKLTWNDVDFKSNLIRVRATTTKTEKARAVGMTNRVREELSALRDNAPKDDSGLVFGIKDTIKRAFATLLREAKIADLHFHDLRHTFVTRCIRAGVPAAEVMKTSGHTQHVTFARYLNIGTEAALKGAELLSQYQSAQEIRSRGPIETSNAVN